MTAEMTLSYREQTQVGSHVPGLAAECGRSSKPAHSESTWHPT